MNSLRSDGMESAFITSKANVYYLTNYYTDPHERLVAVFIDGKGDPLLIIPSMEKEDAIRAGWKGDLLTYDDQTDPWALFSSLLKETNRLPEKMAIEKNHLTVDRYDALLRILPNTELHDATLHLNHSRVRKDKKEYAILKQAAVLADLGVKKGIEAIEEGKTEMEILAEIEYALKGEGVREMSFSTLVLSGEKTASPHGNPAQNKVKPGDFVLFDLGVVYEGYCSDITRTVAFKNVSKKQEEVYQTVLRAQEAAIEVAQIGTEIKKVDERAREIISKAGYGEYFTHRIGHGLGIDVHEYPSLHGKNEEKLEDGMCFTIEPGIYIPGIGGVRIEDEIFVTKNGPEILTSFPKSLQIIG
jgi:Xaa-Pro dipeptidase